MSEDCLGFSLLLSLPLELRNIIYLEVARTYTLNISAKDRRIVLADGCINNACCAMHSKATNSTAASLALVSHQIAFEAHQVAFHRTRCPISVYFSSVNTLHDFECQSALYQPSTLRDLCLSSAQNLLVKAPPAWQALPLPGDCFKALARIMVTGIANVFDIDVLRLSLPWDGWKKDSYSSNIHEWTFLRIR